jgi:predicted MFS family arabinose efflux permease
MRSTDTLNKSLSRFQVMLMAVAAGISVANIYYNQPILKDLSLTFGCTEAQAGLTSMLAQIGYGLGLFFITPLGDKLNKKSLIVNLLILLFLSLLLMIVSSSILQVWILSVLIGILSVAVQVILPMAAGLDSVNRGKTVGTIFTGILIGILAARVFSGAIAEWLSWRWVYGISAGMVLVVTLLLKTYLPEVKTSFKGSYLKLLGSTLSMLRRYSLLRKVALMGAFQFGLFCSFWTTLTFHLSGSPFNFHTDTIGLFGLVAIAGALLAPVFGKASDKGSAKGVQLIATTIMIASILLMLFWGQSVIMLVAAVLLLDIGAQAMQVTNVALIYTLDESSHSRINTIYMTTFFTGGALGTFVGLLCWQAGGWLWVTLQMLTWAVMVLLILLGFRAKKH